ncbi:MAG TPA: pesticin C-terminus-like muramidase [Candidatus Solibacter sp.]|nr:pesticin C-terminus-like muramidase [Candidatus Solibacter sp.]
MIKIEIQLSSHANQAGTITVLDETGRGVLDPLPIAGRLRVRQPNLLPDSPLAGQISESDAIRPGEYEVQQIRPMAGASFDDIQEFGRFGLIVLAPLDLTSTEDGRDAVGANAVFIHGGTIANQDGSSATSDSLHMSDCDLHRLVTLLEPYPHVKVNVRQYLPDIAPASVPGPVGTPVLARLRGLVSALPLAFAAMPGLLPETAAAQQCSQYDSGTNFSAVDFSMINLQVGGDALEGYVPNSSSGVTIAGGLDLGIYTSSQLTNMGFSSTQVAAWTPYCATSCGSVVGAAAMAILGVNPLVISPAEAAGIDLTYYTSSANGIGSLYNSLVTQYNVIPGHTFSQLPMQYQTAMTAMDLTNTSFGTSAACVYLAKGEWSAAITALENYGSSNASVNKLAALYAAYMAKAPQPTF